LFDPIALQRELASLLAPAPAQSSVAQAASGEPSVSNTTEEPDKPASTESDAGAGAVATPSEAEPVAEPKPRRLAALLDSYVRVTLSDGRVVFGRFVCVDRDGNLVLARADEHKVAADEPSAVGGVPATEFVRHLGMTLVPGPHLVAIAVCAADAQRFMETA
jgi:small nuclear ribonucleoprotein (snRNP)-like protein